MYTRRRRYRRRSKNVSTSLTNHIDVERNSVRRRKAAQRRGALARKEDRQVREADIIARALCDIGRLSLRERMLVGTALYWAEGAKSKSHKVSQLLDFCNTDPRMIVVYLAWLTRCLGIPVADILVNLYIHENHAQYVDEAKRYWATRCGFAVERITYVYLKKHKPLTKRRNVGDTYHGLLRVRVRRSTALHRRVQGWTLGICQQYDTIG